MLKVLNLSHNGLGDEGAVAFADALKLNTTLTELDIRCAIYVVDMLRLQIYKKLATASTLHSCVPDCDPLVFLYLESFVSLLKV